MGKEGILTPPPLTTYTDFGRIRNKTCPIEGPCITDCHPFFKPSAGSDYDNAAGLQCRRKVETKCFLRSMNFTRFSLFLFSILFNIKCYKISWVDYMAFGYIVKHTCCRSPNTITVKSAYFFKLLFRIFVTLFFLKIQNKKI